MMVMAVHLSNERQDLLIPSAVFAGIPLIVGFMGVESGGSMELFVVIAWLVLCGASAVYASNKGRSGVGIFFLSLLLSPLVGFVVAFVMEEKVTARHARSGAGAPSYNREFNPDALTKKCPDCAESIKIEALVCRFCGHRFQPEEVQAAIQQASDWGRLRF